MPADVEQIYSDLGEEVWTGGKLGECAPLANPCRKAYADWLGYLAEGVNRPSWDVIVILAAVRRGALTAGVRATPIRGRNWVDFTGRNYWNATRPGSASPERQQSMLWLAPEGSAQLELLNYQIGLEIDELLCAPPRHNPNPTAMPAGGGVPFQPPPPREEGEDEDDENEDRGRDDD
eukprot:4032351-Prymnesium_polylepis.1